MLLAVEIGNSAAHLALFDGASPVATWRHEHQPEPTPPPAALAAARAAVIGGVAPAEVARWASRLEARWPGQVAVIGRDLEPGLPSCYEPSGACGVDRLLAARAAWELVGEAVLVADCGTATTLDLVDDRGCFRGGAILCGVGTARDALRRATALLPAAPLAVPPSAVGQSTLACLQVGLVLAHAEGLAGLAERMRRETGYRRAPLLGTGGAAPLLATARPGLFGRLDALLTTRGLVAAWRQSREEQA